MSFQRQMEDIKIITTIFNKPSGVDYTSHLICSCGTRTELDTNYAMERYIQVECPNCGLVHDSEEVEVVICTYNN